MQFNIFSFPLSCKQPLLKERKREGGPFLDYSINILLLECLFETLFANIVNTLWEKKDW